MLNDGIHQRKNRIARAVDFFIGPTIAPTGIKHREVELVVAGFELRKQVKDHVVHDVASRVRLVRLIHHHDRFKIQLQCFIQNKPRLRHRAFRRIDQKKHAVSEVQHALNLSAEITMSGGVDDIDLHALVFDADIFRQNGNAALTFEVVAIEHALLKFLVVAKQVRLLNNLIHQRRLAVVNMRDDRDIADFFVSHKFSKL